MTLYGKYSTDSIKEIVDVINHLHKKLTKYEMMIVVVSFVGIKTIPWKGG